MKIVLASGGSGGHIFPALETARVLQQRGHDVVLVGVLHTAIDTIEKYKFTYHLIDAHGLKGYSPVTVAKFVWAMVNAVRQAAATIKAIAPDKIIGFGGYGSFAVVMAGIVGGKPTMIHEQNVKPGKANRFLAAFVKRIAISFKESRVFFPSKKTVWTGCPAHQGRAQVSRAAYLAELGLDPQRKTIALLGGSQGSRDLNKIFFEAMGILAGDKKMQAIHMAGKQESAMYASLYRNQNLPVVVKPFISPIEDLYGAVDMVVARAGAATVSELGAHGLAAVLVPYPFAGNHQRYNAQVLARAGAAVLIEQQECTARQLISALEQLSADAYAPAVLKAKTKDVFKAEPAEALADAVEGL